MASEEEISEAVDTALTAGTRSILLFHCISSYPAPVEQSNLRKIINLKKRFGVDIGLSDHTLGITAAIASVALGACAIEKHFTLSRSEKGPDSEFSIEPSELKALVDGTREAWLSLGDENFARPTTEASSLAFRRSIYFVRDLKAGEVITRGDIRRIRPGFGLPPKFFEDLIGKRTKCDVGFGEAVSFEKIE
jgi:N-acetylneuraminate synthase